MEANNILTADVLDIIFDGRNKTYGAYDLRKSYQQRLGKSILIMGGAVVLILTTYVVVAKSSHTDKSVASLGPDLSLTKVEPPKDKIEIIPPPKKIEQPKVEIKQYTKYLLVKENPPENERPPENEDLNKAKIGTINVHGNEDDNLVPTTKTDVTGVVALTKKEDPNDGQPFTKVEIESEYPGGLSAWIAFLNRNLANNYPQAAIDNEIQGTVVIQFIVDLGGNVSDVTAIDGPKELREAAIAVIKKSGKWIPAIQNGHHVISYKRQPITFKLATE